MTGLRDFIAARLAEAEETLKLVPRPYRLYISANGHVSEPESYEWPDNREGEYKQWADGGNYMPNRHTTWYPLFDPDQALREIGAKRRVLERHSPAEEPDRLSGHYMCEGCGFEPSFDGSEPRTEDINDCPELRDLAAIWSDHPDYRPEWSPA